MRNFTQAVVRFVKREDGPTAVEYAVMLGLVIVVCLAAVALIGTGTNEVFKATEVVTEAPAEMN